MRFCCIDPGFVNFGISIEEFDDDAIPAFTGKRYLRDRLPTAEFKAFLYKHIYYNGMLLFYKRVDISPDDGKFSSNIIQSMIKLTAFFDSIRGQLDKCDAFFVERQLRVNPYASKIESHCYSYFSMMYGESRVISDISAADKYSYLGCEHRLTKHKRKKWATTTCLSILECRKDEKTIVDLISNCRKGRKKKLDDISDTVIMCQVMKVKLFTF